MEVERILRLPEVQSATGRKHSSLYGDIGRGLFTRPVEIGPNAKGWPASEVHAINQAKIAGRSEDEVRELVHRLHAKRAAIRDLPESASIAPK